jgi:hypothetical protein
VNRGAEVVDRTFDVDIGAHRAVFHVVDGRITEVWNCGYKQGVWA